MKMATQPQVEYCKTLFRKTKIYYNCLNDQKLTEEVFKRTGFDLDDLLAEEADEIITVLTNVNKERPNWKP